MSYYSDEQRRHEELMAQLQRPQPINTLASIIMGGAAGWLIAAFVLPIALFVLLMALFFLIGLIGIGIKFWPLGIAMLIGAIWLFVWLVRHQRNKGAKQKTAIWVCPKGHTYCRAGTCWGGNR
jgi:hypothetical protein